MNFKKYWLTQSKLIKWIKSPKISLEKKKNNYFTWFPDGKLNIYSNCVEQHLLEKTKNKVAIYFVDKDNKISSLTFKELDTEINKFCFYLIKSTKKQKN